jgi:hypothetical protein
MVRAGKFVICHAYEMRGYLEMAVLKARSVRKGFVTD